MGNCLFLRKGETHTAPISGILASDLAVGSSVYLMENGTAVEYLVVHQGLPSSMYDASCDGCWVLRKDIEDNAVAGYPDNIYKTSLVYNHLIDSFLNKFDQKTLNIIKEVKIPYIDGYGYNGTLKSGSDGLLTKSFLLSISEIGQANHDPYNVRSDDGTLLAYFTDGDSVAANQKRKAYKDGSLSNWWLRSPYKDKQNVLYVDTGGLTSAAYNTSYGVRPALIIPFNALFDKTTLILKGVA